MVDNKIKETAVYVAGDENIFYPALVALTSIEQHNKGVFDRFMCFEGQKLTPKMQAILDYYGIKFIDSNQIGVLSSVKEMNKMDGWWPVEVFLNWALPEHLFKMGYQYSLKSDYDVLCISPYEQDFKKYLAEGQVYSAISTGGPVDEITDETAALVLERCGISCTHPYAINVGFMINDNKAMAKIGFFKKFKELQTIVSSQTPRPKLDEQVVASILMHQLHGGSVKYLDERYNMRVRRSPATDNSFRPDIANVHYITKYKPWLPLTPDDAVKCGETIHQIVPMYRNLWLEYALTLKFFEGFSNEKPLDAMQLIGAIAHGTRGVQRHIKKIKKVSAL